MSTIERLLDGTPIPRMVQVRQKLERPRVVDVEAETEKNCAKAACWPK